MLDDAGACLPDLLHHDGLRGRGKSDCARVVESAGCGGSCETGVSGGGDEEVEVFSGVGGVSCVCTDEVAYASAAC